MDHEHNPLTKRALNLIWYRAGILTLTCSLELNDLHSIGISIPFSPGD